jgi:hypothetical protein
MPVRKRGCKGSEEIRKRAGGEPEKGTKERCTPTPQLLSSSASRIEVAGKPVRITLREKTSRGKRHGENATKKRHEENVAKENATRKEFVG